MGTAPDRDYDEKTPKVSFFWEDMLIAAIFALAIFAVPFFIFGLEHS